MAVRCFANWSVAGGYTLALRAAHKGPALWCCRGRAPVQALNSHLKVPNAVVEHHPAWIVTMETSFMHETRNDTDAERVVLIMRHFHPEARARAG